MECFFDTVLVVSWRHSHVILPSPLVTWNSIATVVKVKDLANQRYHFGWRPPTPPQMSRPPIIEGRSKKPAKIQGWNFCMAKGVTYVDYKNEGHEGGGAGVWSHDVYRKFQNAQIGLKIGMETNYDVGIMEISNYIECLNTNSVFSIKTTLLFIQLFKHVDDELNVIMEITLR